MTRFTFLAALLAGCSLSLLPKPRRGLDGRVMATAPVPPECLRYSRDHGRWVAVGGIFGLGASALSATGALLTAYPTARYSVLGLSGAFALVAGLGGAVMAPLKVSQYNDDPKCPHTGSAPMPVGLTMARP